MIVDVSLPWQVVLGQVFLEKTRQSYEIGARFRPHRTQLHPAARVGGDHGLRSGGQECVALLSGEGQSELGGGEMIGTGATATELRILRLHELGTRTLQQAARFLDDALGVPEM